MTTARSPLVWTGYCISRMRPARGRTFLRATLCKSAAARTSVVQSCVDGSMRSAPLPAGWIDRLPRAGLAVLFAFTGLALAGFATFGQHPSLLVRFPQLAGFYRISFDFFAQAQIWMAWLVLAAFLSLRVGARWLIPFV